MRKHQVLLDIHKELLLLLQSKEAGLVENIPEQSKMAEEAGLTMPQPRHDWYFLELSWAA